MFSGQRWGGLAPPPSLAEGKSTIRVCRKPRFAAGPHCRLTLHDPCVAVHSGEGGLPWERSRTCKGAWGGEPHPPLPREHRSLHGANPGSRPPPNPLGTCRPQPGGPNVTLALGERPRLEKCCRLYTQSAPESQSKGLLALRWPPDGKRDPGWPWMNNPGSKNVADCIHNQPRCPKLMVCWPSGGSWRAKRDPDRPCSP